MSTEDDEIRKELFSHILAPSSKPSFRNTSFEISSSYSSLAPLPHSRQSSFDSLGSTFKGSPTSLDMGYHTMRSFEDRKSKGARPKELRQESRSNGKLRHLRQSLSSHNYFDGLSDELLLEILRYLSAKDLIVFSFVCHRFYCLSWSLCLWKSFELKGPEAFYALESILIHLSSFNSQTSLSNVRQVSIFNSIGESTLFSLAQKCTALKKVTFKNCENLSNEAIKTLLSHSHSLIHLDLSGCSSISRIDLLAPEPSPATAALVGVPPASPKILYLQSLNLSECIRVTDSGLKSIVKNAPHLRQLYLRRCIKISDIGIAHIAINCVHLKELSVSDCFRISDVGCSHLSKYGPHLRYLSLAKCEEITDFGLSSIARLCTKLRYLNIRGCVKISDSTLKTLSVSCKRLKALDIGKTDVTNDGLEYLSRYNLSLKKLSLKSCEMLSDEGLHCIAHQCRNLIQLNIQDCSFSRNAIENIKKYCPNCIIEHTNPGFF